MDTLWTVLITCFHFRVYDFVRGEMVSFTQIPVLLKVRSALTFCCFHIYRKYCINVDVHLFRVFLLAVGAKKYSGHASWQFSPTVWGIYLGYRGGVGWLLLNKIIIRYSLYVLTCICVGRASIFRPTPEQHRNCPFEHRNNTNNTGTALLKTVLKTVQVIGGCRVAFIK